MRFAINFVRVKPYALILSDVILPVILKLSGITNLAVIFPEGFSIDFAICGKAFNNVTISRFTIERTA